MNKTFCLKAEILTGNTVSVFEFRGHVHKQSPIGLILDETQFYSTWGEVPSGIHHEIEILRPPVWVNDNWPARIHTYRPVTDNTRHFVCYPRPIPDERKLEEVIKLWCVGTAYTLLTDNDFQLHPLIVAGNKPAFFEEMERVYGIRFLTFEIL